MFTACVPSKKTKAMHWRSTPPKVRRAERTPALMAVGGCILRFSSYSKATPSSDSSLVVSGLR